MNNSQKEGSRFIDVLVQKGFLHAGLSETLALAECLNRIIDYRVEKAIDEDRTILSMLDDCSPSSRHDQQVRKEAIDKVMKKCAERFHPYCGGDQVGDVNCFDKLSNIVKEDIPVNN